MQVGRGGDVPRQDVVVGVVRDGVLVEAEVDLGREEQEAGRTDGIDRLGIFEQHGVGQPAAA